MTFSSVLTKWCFILGPPTCNKERLHLLHNRKEENVLSWFPRNTTYVKITIHWRFLFMFFVLPIPFFLFQHLILIAKWKHSRAILQASWKSCEPAVKLGLPTQCHFFVSIILAFHCTSNKPEMSLTAIQPCVWGGTPGGFLCSTFLWPCPFSGSRPIWMNTWWMKGDSYSWAPRNHQWRNSREAIALVSSWQCSGRENTISKYIIGVLRLTHNCYEVWNHNIIFPYHSDVWIVLKGRKVQSYPQRSK